MASKLSVLLTFVVLLGCALHTQALTQISNCIELQAMQNNLTEAYELANDIDCSDTVNWNDGEGFEAVGRPSCPFTGELDGRGHVIKDLVINRHVSNMGLFGYTNSTAKITSLKLLDIFIAGNSYVGGLIGKSEGVLISNCVVEGIVRPISASGNYFGGLVADFRGTLTHSSVKGDVGSVSTGWYVGGLVGRNLGNISESYADANTNGAGNDVGGLVGVNAGGSISDCFAAGDTYSKGWHVGGLVGTNRGIIRNCYSSGRPSSPNYLGGLVGTSSDAELVSFSYWDIQASGLSNSGGGVGKTTEEMKQEVTFEYWDFNSIWFVVSGHSYPQFRTTQIHTCEQLQYIPLNVDIYLMQDIACSQTASWNGGAGFIPIGTEAPFTGNFSGQGFIISNLFITRNDELDVGLFSVTKGAVIQNVGLHDVSLIGAQNVGSLIAKASAGTVVSRCHANGYIEGRGTQIGVGGLIGEAESSHIEDSYSITEVVMLGSSISGGLIGRADASTIVNCFSASELKFSG